MPRQSRRGKDIFALGNPHFELLYFFLGAESAGQRGVGVPLLARLGKQILFSLHLFNIILLNESFISKLVYVPVYSLSEEGQAVQGRVGRENFFNHSKADLYLLAITRKEGDLQEPGERYWVN